MTRPLMSACVCVALAGIAKAADLAVWTFETSIPTNAGPHAAEGGINGGQAGGLHGNPATVYSNPSGNGSPESFSSNAWNPNDYYQFTTSTIGYGNIRVSWDQTRSSTGPGQFLLLASTDGLNFNPIIPFNVLENSAANGGFWSSGGPRVPNYGFGPIPVPGLENQPSVHFRLLNQSTPPGPTAGTNRVDNVVIAGDVGGVPGACCFPGGCAEIDQSLCSEQGGIPQGPGTTCGPLTCGPPPEPCCLATGACQLMPGPQCSSSGGTPVSHCPLDGRCIPPSDDCFTTACGRTLFDFCNDPIPADFFAPSSEPFTGIIILGGDGAPDTTVRRFNAMLLDGPPETIPIELVELSLTGCSPITVRIGTMDTLWDVAVDLAPNPVPPGSMTVTKQHPNGGVFTAQFNVLPRFVFTEVVNPGNQRVLDFGLEGLPPTLFETTGTPQWVYQSSLPALICGVNFVPGVEENPLTLEQCCTETCHANPGGGHDHCTKTCNVCPRGACCDPPTGCTVVEGAAMCNGQYKGDGTNCDDSDGDGVPDWFENNACCQPSTPCNAASNPNDPDTDNDGVNDGAELAMGRDPCVSEIGACCYPDGSCAQQTPTVCTSQGGEPQAVGSVCAGDNDGNGIDDLCQDRPCDDCGPGPHWIHAPAPCPAGTNHIPTTAAVGVDTNNDGIADTTLNLAGPTTVQHNVASDDSNNFPGTRPVDGHIDVIDYEMTYMNLTGGGATIIAGAGLGSNPLAATLGAMAEQAGNPALADGFFEVFFELDLGGGSKLYNQTPLRINAANLDCFAPVLLGLNPPGLIPLFTSPTGGSQVANLVTATHTTFPPPGACCYKDGSCAQQTATVCTSQGGEPQGAGSVCAGDLNGNGIDDLCEDRPCDDCGPGPHWIHAPAPCPAGTNHIPTTAAVGVDTNNDGIADTTLNLAGPTTVQHNVASDDSNNFPGTRPVDGHIDVIDYEMTYMNLTGGGATIIAGAGLGSNPLAATLGAMAEQAGNPALADGFFDVFFELDLGGGSKLYNQTPLRINAANLDCFAPVLLGLNPPGIIPLFTSPTGGSQVANLVTATHTTFPQPAACCYKDGSCAQQTATVCTSQGGEPQAAGSVCQGDNDGNGIDDLCQDDPCDDCGPGPHWIHAPAPCPAGTNHIPTTAAVGVDTNNDGIADTTLNLAGPTTVQHNVASDDSNSFPGTRPVDGHIDVIDYEMTYMNLTGGGATIIAGAGLGSNPLAATLGAMAEQAGNPALADGFFDVFFELDLGGGSKLYNQTPLRINAANLDCFAPVLLGLNPPGIIPLFTSPTGGSQVANLVTATHTTFPQPGACCYNDGTCAQQTATVCTSQGGEPQAAGSVCQGDNNANGIDDLCEDAPCADCGPGPHWIHNPECPPGTDHIPTSAYVGVDTNLDGTADTFVFTSGPSGVSRSGSLDDSNQFPGTRPIDGHRDVIDTEIVALTLTGGGLTLIAGAGRGDIPLAASLGNMAEQPGDPSQADSFFDVFFELDLGQPNKLYNQTPCKVRAVVTCIPPQTIYAFDPGGPPLQLYTSPIPGQGTHVANMTSAYHFTHPQPQACCNRDGTCTNIDPAACVAAGGEPQGAGSVCAGDLNGNGIDDLCEDAPCADCGPGPHWIHNPECPPGTDLIPTSAYVGVDTNLDGTADTFVFTSGPSGVSRSGSLDDSNQFPGTRPIDGHRDVIDTEIVALTLTGGGLTLIAGAGRGDIPLAASLGNMAEQPGDPSQADSFFDVFFELDLGQPNKLYNQTPCKVRAVVTCIPPQTIYAFDPGGPPLQLYTSPIPGQGTHVANMTSAYHFTHPQPQACCNRDGTCTNIDPAACVAAGGEPQGAGSVCQGDNNANGIDDLCEDAPCADCGPGPHWIHVPTPCPPGTNYIPTAAVLGLDLNLDGIVDTNLPLSGPTTVQHNVASDDSANYPGLAPVDGHIDVIDYEMTYLSLTGGGATVTAGAGLGAIPLAASLGAMREQVGNPSLADGFFDIFFEIDLGGGNRLYNHTALRINAPNLDCFGPILLGFNPQGLLPLFTSPTGGQQVANLGPARHSTFSPPGVFPASITSAVSRKACDINLLPEKKSESRQAGITQLVLGFDAPVNSSPNYAVSAGGPGGPGVAIQQATCLNPVYVNYAGILAGATANASGNILTITVPAMANARTYRLNLGGNISSAAQNLQVRGLVGDVDGNGAVNATDRSVVVGVWSGSSFTCVTDLDGSGGVNATDRSIAVGAWTSTQNCAP